MGLLAAVGTVPEEQDREPQPERLEKAPIPSMPEEAAAHGTTAAIPAVQAVLAAAARAALPEPMGQREQPTLAEAEAVVAVTLAPTTEMAARAALAS